MTQKPWEHAKSSGSEGDPLAARFVSSLDYDKRLYKHDIAGSIAHARMLKHVKLITAKELRAIEKGLKDIEKEIDTSGGDWPGWKVELEDVHMCIEAALIEKAGDAGRKLHTGRSRNDQVALDLVLWVREATGQVNDKIVDLLQAFLNLAEREGRLVMPSYTHLQRAQPIVAGGEMMAWMDMLERATARLTANPSIQHNPLGGGAIAGSSLPLDRRHTTDALFEESFTADELTEAFQSMFGLNDEMMASVNDATSISRNSIDATASRDAALDFTFGLTMVSMTLSRWAEQWIIYAHDRVRLHHPRQPVHHRLVDDAPEAEPGHARTHPRQDRAGLRLADGAADDVQGPDHRLQPRPAGRQAARLRRLRRGLRLPRHGRRHRADHHLQRKNGSRPGSTAGTSTRHRWRSTW